MESDIYNACRHNDIDYVRVLIETTPDNVDINRLELNGSTALHLACSKGCTNIVQLLLNDHRVDQHRTNKDGKTAYQVASTKEIRQLFSRLKYSDNPFCTDQNTLNPLQIITNEDTSDSRYTTFYPTDVAIMRACYYKVLDNNYNTITLPIINRVRSFFGNDPNKKKIDKWVEDLQFHIKQCFIEKNCELNSTLCLNACKCIEIYKETRNIEHLLRLYTLHTSMCQYFAQDSIKTDYLYAPISFHLLSVEERAYKGFSFRGLTMKQNEFKKYKRAFYCKGSYIKTNTFCSTSIDPAVAEMFADTNKTRETINVIMIFEFVKSCLTALTLFSTFPHLKCISNFEDEKEVLIFPGTIFSVKDIQEDNQNQLTSIHLEQFNTADAENEMHQERFQSYIDTFFTYS